MKIFPDTKVYVLCPANYHSGGPELCHQLASQLISFGVEAYMLYLFNVNSPANTSDPVHDALKKYHVPYVLKCDDSPNNIVVVPETITTIGFYSVKNCRHVLWWMSVNNFLSNITNALQCHLNNPLAEPMPKFFKFDTEDNDTVHFVQSEYARQFVKLNGIADDKIFMVEDYLNQEFLSGAAHVDLTAKKNIVAYNPKKGFEITEHLIKLAPDIDWRPIKGMTPAQVQNLLAQAKVYIDFGSHPGKDRIPREAAISGCVVITGKRGAAANDIDINIPAEFKFNERAIDGQPVIKKIREVFDNFAAAYAKQADYRARILDDKNRFTKEVAEAFELENFPPPTVALVQGVCEKSFLLAEELLRGNDFTPSFIVDDELATAKISDELIMRYQNRNYLRVGEYFIEVITRDDAKFLYREGRIKKFMLLEPTADEFAAVNDFYAPNVADVLNVERISAD